MTAISSALSNRFFCCHSCMVWYYTRAFILLSRELSEMEETMPRCPQCGGYLSYEPEILETPARLWCIACGWMLDDPNFRKEKPRYFPSDSMDKRIEWRQSIRDMISTSRKALLVSWNQRQFLKYSIRQDRSAPVIMSWGLIACNTPALQSWWDGKRHHDR